MSVSTNVTDPTSVMSLPAPADPPSVSLVRLFSVVWARKFFILWVALALFCVASWAILSLPEYYLSTASVLVGTRDSVGDPSISDSKVATATDSVAIRTQVDLLKSFSLARQVVQQLDLVKAPEFARTISPRPSLVRTVTVRLRQAMGRPEPPPLDEASTIDLATDLLLGKMSFTNDGRSFVINIGAKTTDPRLSANIANAYAQAYIDFTRKVKTDAIAHASSWFDARLSALKDKVNAANSAVQLFRANNGLILDRGPGGSSPENGGGVTIAGQQMSQINTQLSVASSALAEKAASLAQIRAAGADLDAIPEVVASPLIQHYREQLADVSAKAAHLAITRSDNDPGMRSLLAEQRDIRGRIAAEVHNIAASVANEVNAAKAREDALQRQLAALQVKVSSQGVSEVRLTQLQSEADAARAIYTSYLNWFERTSNEIGLQTPDAQLVSSGNPAIGPVAPSKRQLMALSAVVALAAATALALLRERAVSGFQTPEQLESETGLPAIGIVPERKAIRFGLASAGNVRRFDDAITLTRSMLQHRGSAKTPQVVLVTSAIPREGKTFFALALAKNAAAAGRNTLLIDGDLRRPEIAALLGMKGGAGLEAIMAEGGCRVQTYTGGSQPFDVITASAGVANPQDLLASHEVQDMLTRARSLYDLIILDAPPILGFADARVLSTLCDSTLLVVKWSYTPQKLVAAAIAALRLYGARIEGAIINQVAANNQSVDENNMRGISRRYAALLK